MRRRRSLPLALLALVACGGEPPVGEEDQPIIGGSSDAGKDLGVAMLHSRIPGFIEFCTATMITPRVVLTAAHCVDDTTSEQIWFADRYDHDTGTFEGQLDDTRRVRTVKFVHPRWGGASEIGNGFDIALLLLDIPAPEAAAPIPWLRYRLLDDVVGQELRMVGYGDRTFQSDSLLFLKLTARNDVSRLSSYTLDLVDSTKITCQGDSGGPAFLTVDGEEVVAGITSYGDVGCASLAAFTRVDLYLPEIRDFIAANDPQPAQACSADGTCDVYCSAPDPDCPCAGEGVCTPACAEPDRDPDCPMHCLGDGTCVREGCPLPDPDCGNAPIGAACAVNNNCASEHCHPTLRVCADTCGTGAACGDGFSCGATNFCEPASESGCGCQATPGTPGWWGGLLAAALALLFRRAGSRG
jgi:MYXO-CTERM domain-containing protein